MERGTWKLSITVELTRIPITSSREWPVISCLHMLKNTFEVHEKNNLSLAPYFLVKRSIMIPVTKKTPCGKNAAVSGVKVPT